MLVAGLEATGVVAEFAGALRQAASSSEKMAAGGAGVVMAVACNLVNNLPAGLLAGAVIVSSEATPGKPLAPRSVYAARKI